MFAVRALRVCTWLTLLIAPVSVAPVFLLVFAVPTQAAWLKTNEGCQVFMNRLPQQASASWSGRCAGGKASGKGTFAMTTEREDGKRTSKITGVMREGKFSGTVSIAPGNGDRLEGPLRDGKLVAGTIRYGDKRHYAGPIANGLPHGKGVMHYPDGGRYEGEFQNGIRQGQGVVTFANGAGYRGGWLRDLRHGKGIYTTSKGMVITGTFKNDRLKGRARFTRADGTWFDGPTKKQNPHGKGTCGSTQTNTSKKCQFRLGKFVR